MRIGGSLQADICAQFVCMCVCVWGCVCCVLTFTRFCHTSLFKVPVWQLNCINVPTSVGSSQPPWKGHFVTRPCIVVA